MMRAMLAGVAAMVMLAGGCVSVKVERGASPAVMAQPESTPQTQPAIQPETKPAAQPVDAAGALTLPASAAPVPELAPLAFMEGRWIGINPNKTVNEEHWMAPRGNHMIAMFRQVRRDGKPAFVELSLVTVEKDGVKLRLRHLHGGLEVPKGREELSVFTLKSAENNRVEFTGTGKAEQVTAVIYRLVDEHTMEAEIQFAPDSKEKGFTTVYRRAK
jgi:hypothetical protein